MTQSILVLTHHKAASTFLRRMLTSTISLRYKVVDYAGAYWKRSPEGRRWANVYEMLNEDAAAYFSETGHIYGPIRETIKLDYYNFRRVIVARDPAETLLSEYVSFAFTHPEPPMGGKAREIFLARRQAIRAMSVDEYAEAEMERLHKRMRELADARDSATLVLPYKLIAREPREAITLFQDFADISTPIWLTQKIVRLRQRLSSNRMHQSRKHDFSEYRLSDQKCADISARFADVSSRLGL